MAHSQVVKGSFSEAQLGTLIAQAVERLGKLAETKLQGRRLPPVAVLFTNPDGSSGQAWFDLQRSYRPPTRTGAHVTAAKAAWAVVVRADERARNGVWIEVAPLAWRVLFAREGVKALADAIVTEAEGATLRVDDALDELQAWLRATDPEGV